MHIGLGGIILIIIILAACGGPPAVARMVSGFGCLLAIVVAGLLLLWGMYACQSAYDHRPLYHDQ